jgi:hypothetical protein
MSVPFTMLVLLAAAFGARLSYREPPVPRTKPGESPAEAHIMLLGAFRIYTWLVWVVAATMVVGYATGVMAYSMPRWYQLLLIATGVALLSASNSLYWRLGYDWRRYLFVLGHLSGAFCVAEYLWALRRDVESYIVAEEQRRAG